MLALGSSLGTEAGLKMGKQQAACSCPASGAGRVWTGNPVSGSWSQPGPAVSLGQVMFSLRVSAFSAAGTVLEIQEH